jgi:PAS domain S-box-containing protein
MKKSDEMNQDYLASAISEIEDYAIILMDTEGNILNWNKGAQNIKGYTSEEIIGKNFQQFYTESDKRDNKPGTLINKAREAGRAHDEGFRVRKDGSLFWGSITITAVHNENGDVVGFSKVTRDLTERKKADTERERHDQELHAKNKELEQFLYIASHDLQEPVRTISNYTSLLLRNYMGQLDKDGRKMFEFIGQSCTRMTEMIKGLLDYSKIGVDKKLTSIDCNSILDLVKSDLALIIDETNTIITIEKLPIVEASEMDIRLLFQNLLSNAIKFRRVDAAPEIHVSAKNYDDGFFQFSIKDNGIGINPKFGERIFQIFQRLHLKHEYDGSGIGLAHCSKIVELHGGKIWVDSGPGEGSTFHFTISKNKTG